MEKNPLGDSLSGISVLDFSTNVAGPYASMILADLGADVTKIERKGVGDPSRSMNPTWGETSAVHYALNRGKRSIELDLKSDSDTAHALELATHSEIIIESYRPGVMDRLGLGFEAIRNVNPQLAYCSISGFGYEPNSRDIGAYDPIIQAFSGHLEMTGDPDGGPARSGASIVDVSAGMWAAMGVLSVLQLPSRERGIHIQISLLDSILAVMAHQVAAVSLTGVDLPRLGTASPLLAPYEAFQTADKLVMIAAGNQDLFRRLCDTLELTTLTKQAEFETNSNRVKNRALLKERIEERLQTQSADDWVRRLNNVGVPCSPVNTLREALSEPEVRDRNTLQWMPNSPMPLVANPIRVDRRPMVAEKAHSLLGEQSQ